MAVEHSRKEKRLLVADHRFLLLESDTSIITTTATTRTTIIAAPKKNEKAIQLQAVVEHSLSHSPKTPRSFLILRRRPLSDLASSSPKSAIIVAVKKGLM